MPERPIIFSAPMVRAILDGRKTQTRRILKPQPPADCSPLLLGWGSPTLIDRNGEEYPGEERFQVWSELGEFGCPIPWHAGGRLWVRETWSHPGDGVWTIGEARRRGGQAIYRADRAASKAAASGIKWWPSIHMPREFSRITLNVSGVRVERLQDISEGDAVAEGMTHTRDPSGDGTDSRDLFAILWSVLHGPGSWHANPWVVAISFQVAEIRAAAEMGAGDG